MREKLGRIRTRLKKVKWGKVERILGRVATVLTVLFAAASAYYAYEAVQVAVNPVTTVEVGRGNFTMTDSRGNVFSPVFSTTEYRISAYRYAIVYPYFIVDTRLGYRPNSLGPATYFGPVYTDVIVDGVTRGRIVYPVFPYDSQYGSVVNIVPRNVSTVTGLGLVTHTYCVGNCTIPNAEVFVRADLVR